LEIIIATTTNPTDDPIVEFAVKNNILFHRGSESNVLSRYYEAADKNKLDVIIRVTSDCPLIDPHLIKSNIEDYDRIDNPNLYMSNTIERTFARGFDFEIFSFSSLKDAFLNATEESDREHVTPYLWKNKSGKIDFKSVYQHFNHSNLRLTVDTLEDFELIRILIEEYGLYELSYYGKSVFDVPYFEIESLLLDHPELIRINSHIGQKEV
jgi:spore coat polysaccharide biosynthesis protein SpsF